MLHISPLRDNTLPQFKKLFTDYYAELGCDDDCNHLLDEYVVPDLLAGLLYIDILQSDDDFAGFVIYQRDDVDNEWNFKEGWGDVRELFVAPPFRRKGCGKFLLCAAEAKLRDLGCEKCYALPAEEAVPFFEKCGYAATNAYCNELDCPVFEKLNLESPCKGQTK